MLSKIKKLFKSNKKKTIKKSLVKKPKKKITTKKKTAKKTTKPTKTEELVGIITHYFPHVKAGVIKIKKGTISQDDSLHIKGHTTDFIQKATSIQIDRKPVTSASKGKEIGILVKKRVRHNDKVFKLR